MAEALDPCPPALLVAFKNAPRPTKAVRVHLGEAAARHPQKEGPGRPGVAEHRLGP